MERVLIIKLGALGDVVRTTPLLRALAGEVTWVTAPGAVPLLRGNPKISRLLDLSRAASLRKEHFDLVLNLEEDREACRLAMEVSKRELIGPYLTAAGADYTDSSAEWFDMSLISRYGKKHADRKKLQNRRTYQEILFSMAGLKFRGEEYMLPDPGPRSKAVRRGTVGLEARSGERWVAKRWPRFPELVAFLKEYRVPHRAFRQSPTLMGFLRQVRDTDAVVTTDSLALHLALGLKKKTVALFSCTSPHEIHGYGRTVKIVSPLLKRFYYSTKNTQRPGEAIEPQTVFKALRRLAS